MSLLGSIGVTIGGALISSIFGDGDDDKETSATGNIVSTSSTKAGLMTAPKTVQKFAPSSGYTKSTKAGAIAGGVPALKSEDPQNAARRMAAIFAQAKQMSQIG